MMTLNDGQPAKPIPWWPVAILLLAFAAANVVSVDVLTTIGELPIGRYSLALCFMTPVVLMMPEFIPPQAAFVLVGDRTMETSFGTVVVAVTRTLGVKLDDPSSTGTSSGPQHHRLPQRPPDGAANLSKRH